MAKMRSHNEGSIYQRKEDGLWVTAITLGRDASGKTQRQKIYGRTRKEVAAQLTAKLAERNREIILEPTKQTVGQFLDSWMNDVKRGSVRSTTYETYEYVLRHAEPIRHLPLAKVTAQQVQRLVSDLHNTGLGRTIEVLHAVLHQAFAQAVKWDLLARNIIDLVTVPKNEKKEFTRSPKKNPVGFSGPPKEIAYTPCMSSPSLAACGSGKPSDSAGRTST